MRYIWLHKNENPITRHQIMYTTTEEGGRLNNYAVEPKMYLASDPEPKQQRRYLLQGGLAALLIGALLFTATIVS